MGADANVPGALRLRGTLDQSALQGALQQVMCRHDALRTRFAFRPDGPIVQVMPESGLLHYSVYLPPSISVRLWSSGIEYVLVVVPW